MKKGFMVVSVVLIALYASVAFAQEEVAGASSIPGGKQGPRVVAPVEETGGCCACPPEPFVTGDVYAGPMNKYLFRGNDLSANRWVVQGGADLYYKDWTLSYWGNYQTKATDTLRNFTEHDLALNYAYTPHELVTLNVGNYMYDYANVTTNELYLKANLNTLLTPTLAVYWDWDKASRAGLYYAASVSHKLVIERNVLSATFGALASYNQWNNNTAVNVNSNDPFDGAYSGFHNYELSASADYTVNGHITITPSYLFSNALTAKARNLAGIGPEHAYGIKATFAF